MPGAAAHVSDYARPGQLGEGFQEGAIQRLGSQLFTELVMVGAGGCGEQPGYGQHQ